VGSDFESFLWIHDHHHRSMLQEAAKNIGRDNQCQENNNYTVIKTGGKNTIDILLI